MKKLLQVTVLTAFSFLFVFSEANAQQIILTTDASQNSCDGTAWFADSISLNSTSVYWSGGGVVIQQGGFSVSGLCAGTYTASYNDPFLGNSTTTFIINTSTDPCAGFTVSYTSTQPLSPVSCDGSIVATANGGTAPYVYSWSDGSMTAAIYNLCDGLYECTIVDANGCAATVTGVLGQNGILDSTIVIDNNNYPDSTVIDTLGTSWIDDCLLDFLSIDSVNINGMNFMNADTILVNWVVIDTNGVVLLDLLVPYTNPNGVAGVYALTMTIFCPQKALGVNTLIATDKVFINPESLGLAQNSNTEIGVVNPFTDKLILHDLPQINSEITITDMMGRTVYSVSNSSSSELIIESNNWNKGIYFLSVVAGSEMFVKTLIKE